MRFSLAAFQVITIGRSWVITEAPFKSAVSTSGCPVIWPEPRILVRDGTPIPASSAASASAPLAMIVSETPRPNSLMISLNSRWRPVHSSSEGKRHIMGLQCSAYGWNSRSKRVASQGRDGGTLEEILKNQLRGWLSRPVKANSSANSPKVSGTIGTAVTEVRRRN